MGCSSINVSQGRAYTQGNKNETDTVFCFDATTGKELWKHSYPCPLQPKFWEGGTLATPTVDGERVYSISKVGDLFCFDAATGLNLSLSALNMGEHNIAISVIPVALGRKNSAGCQAVITTVDKAFKQNFGGRLIASP